MRVLFDNGTPRQLRNRLFCHDVVEVRERGWDTLANGGLQVRAVEAGLEALITTDQDSRCQQNMSNRRVGVTVLMNTAWPDIARRTEDIRYALVGIQPGKMREVRIPKRGEA